MTNAQKTAKVEKELAKAGTNLHELTEAHHTYFTHLAEYYRSHENEPHDEEFYDASTQYGLCQTAEKHHKIGTMKWLVRLLVRSAELRRSEFEKWTDYVEIAFASEKKVADKLVDWEMKYHPQAFQGLLESFA